jgi:hypothetical protein
MATPPDVPFCDRVRGVNVHHPAGTRDQGQASRREP